MLTNDSAGDLAGGESLFEELNRTNAEPEVRWLHIVSIVQEQASNQMHNPSGYNVTEARIQEEKFSVEGARHCATRILLSSFLTCSDCPAMRETGRERCRNGRR